MAAGSGSHSALAKPECICTRITCNLGPAVQSGCREHAASCTLLTCKDSRSTVCACLIRLPYSGILLCVVICRHWDVYLVQTSILSIRRTVHSHLVKFTVMLISTTLHSMTNLSYAQESCSNQVALPHTGTSSFGMSGVNAHAILSGPAIQAQNPRPVLLHLMQRHPYWPVPKPHHLLECTVKGRLHCCFLLNMSKPELAYLGDHKVGVYI